MDAPPQPPPANPSDSWASRSRVSIDRGEPGGDATAVVVLGMPYTAVASGPMAIGRAGLLERELLRQAFLIAARDELGLNTSDEVLGERRNIAKPTASGPELVTIPGPEGSIRLVIAPENGSAGEALLDRDLTKPSPKNEGSKSTGYGPAREDLADLTIRTEALSRSELPDVLRKLGARGKPNATNAEGKVPESIENRLNDLSFASVFAALKDLHGLIRSDGESPSRLGALVRGYALLGLLTEFQWHPAHKAYKARSLLYAQRLVARDPNGTWGLWHRALRKPSPACTTTP